MTRHTLAAAAQLIHAVAVAARRCAAMKSWLVRTYRGGRLDRNPLRRPIDRAETVVGVGLLLLCAAAVPFTARVAAAQTHTLAQRARSAELASRHEVTAITRESAPPATATAYTPVIRTWVSAMWTGPDGRQWISLIDVPAGTERGSAERIWVTGDGDVVVPPLTATAVAQLADGAAVGAVTMLICLVLAAVRVTRRVMDRRRMAAWDAEWAATAPMWNRQRW